MNDGSTDCAGVEDQLRAQEAFYRNIVEGAADVTTLLAPDGTILYASASMTDQNSLGYAPHEVIGRNTLDIIHPDDRKAVARAITRDLAGHPTTVEARVRKRDGTWMWAEVRGKAIVGLDGTTMVVAYSRNIDERKRLQERLKNSEEYYKSLLRGSSDLVTVIDESGILVFASDSMQTIFGYRLDEVIGQPIFSQLSCGRSPRWRPSASPKSPIPTARLPNSACGARTGAGVHARAPAGALPVPTAESSF